jgi:hypothetical protein
MHCVETLTARIGSRCNEPSQGTLGVIICTAELTISSRSIIEAISAIDGFKYIERNADNKEGGDGARFKYICQDSLQNRGRKSNMKKEKPQESDDGDDIAKRQGPSVLPTFDCGGAIHVKFSLKREAINVVYKHNLIHTRQSEDRYVPSKHPLHTVYAEFSHSNS